MDYFIRSIKFYSGEVKTLIVEIHHTFPGIHQLHFKL